MLTKGVEPVWRHKARAHFGVTLPYGVDWLYALVSQCSTSIVCSPRDDNFVVVVAVRLFLRLRF